MRPPEFWRSDGALARLLDPVGRLQGLGGRLRRRFTTPYQAAVPVICIGNLTVGGTGKTPVAIAVARRLQAFGVRPHFLTRGYGGQLSGPVRVEPAEHDARAVGDEPLLLARVAPTWVAHDRAAGARAAVADGARAIVMDDGFQNPGLVQDRALLVVDGEAGFGNGRLLPAGPLREPVADGLGRAAAVVLIGRDRQGLASTFEVPVLAADLVMRGGEDLRGRRVIAFAGIGRPEKFFRALRGQGAQLVEGRAFPDHHVYARGELADLATLSESRAAELATTAKDAVRLPPTCKDRVHVLDVEVRFAELQRLDAVLSLGPDHDGSTRYELRPVEPRLNDL